MVGVGGERTMHSQKDFTLRYFKLINVSRMWSHGKSPGLHTWVLDPALPTSDSRTLTGSLHFIEPHFPHRKTEVSLF